jgi:hypothetical protein
MGLRFQSNLQTPKKLGAGRLVWTEKRFNRISGEIMCFMRGKYRLDELSDGKNELKFRQDKKAILTIEIHDDKYTFLIIVNAGI